LTLSLQATHPDGSVHDVTDCLLQRQTASRRAREHTFRLEGDDLRACTRFQFGLLSSTIDKELCARGSEPAAARLASPPASPRQRVLGEIATAARRMYLERGQSLTNLKRIRKRDRKRVADRAAAPPPARQRGVCAPRPPPPRRPSGPLSTFRFVVTPSHRSDAPMPFLQWESEPFVSVAACASADLAANNA